MSDLTRRATLAASAVLPWATAQAVADAGASPMPSGSRVLVAFFTRSGNTKVIAGTVQRDLKADLFEIRPAQPYPEDYEETVAQAQRETERRYEPPLAATVPDIAAYDTVFLGLPIWGTTAPPVIRSFLRSHDLKGRTLRPIITHGGYGLGDSMAVIRAHASGAMVAEPFSMEADQERRTLNKVRGWLGSIKPG
ncbi:flavodoxin [Methylobacterium sp. W2]|uniref:flavodoxin n=1 Tax=Methylobacterium sp. W2 TaxID=2598107 RepID=UPI001D0C04E0|nr:flavodoxin [Methylobacterium sp. W2]MCC0808043.1 flavodoxin [Methylobacterium sp. W2]